MPVQVVGIRSCLSQILFEIIGGQRLGSPRQIRFGEDALRNTIREFVTHFTSRGTIKGLENRLIVPLEMIASEMADVEKLERLGGLLDYYREVA